MPARTIRPRLPVHLPLTLSPLQVGRGDPTIALAADAAARASHTPDGPATLVVRRAGTVFEAEAWGPGAAWVLEHAPRLLGVDDHLDGFAAQDRMVARAHRRLPGLRIGASGLVADVLPATILQQKVTGGEAKRAWRGLCRAWGEPAPGPAGLRLPPRTAVLASQPYWAFHRFGVERRRAETIIRACRRIDRLEEAATMGRAAARSRLTALTGLGPWTAAVIERVAFGDADAVELGDFHLPHWVSWALAGEPRGDDARMLDLLAPYAGHRGRVIRLIEVGCQRPPAYGPRMPVRRLEHL